MQNARPTRFLIVFPFLHSWEPIQLPNLLLKGSHEIENESSVIKKHFQIIPHFIRDARGKPITDFLYGFLDIDKEENFEIFAQRFLRSIETFRWLLFDPLNPQSIHVPYFEQTIFYIFEICNFNSGGLEKSLNYYAAINSFPEHFASERSFLWNTKKSSTVDFDPYNMYLADINYLPENHKEQMQILFGNIVEKSNDTLYLSIWWYNRSFKHFFWEPEFSVASLYTAFENLFPQATDPEQLFNQYFESIGLKAKGYINKIKEAEKVLFQSEEPSDKRAAFLDELLKEIKQWFKEFKQVRNRVVHGKQILPDKPINITPEELRKRESSDNRSLSRSFWYLPKKAEGGREYIYHPAIAQKIFRLAAEEKHVGIPEEDLYSELKSFGDLLNVRKTVLKEIYSEIKNWDRKKPLPFFQFNNLLRIRGPIDWKIIKEILVFLVEQIRIKQPNFWKKIQTEVESLLSNLDNRKEKYKDCWKSIININELLHINRYEATRKRTIFSEESRILDYFEDYLEFLNRANRESD